MSQQPVVLAGRYRIEEELGRGGMARVYRGTDTVLGRPVAIKVLAPQFAEDADFVARFRREAQAAARLNHPNLVSVYDTGSDKGTHFIVMEFVDGRTLADFLSGGARVLPSRAIEIADLVLRALQAAHAQGVVHRDIKPANIMITTNGGVKVTDFGIARVSSSGETLAATTAVLGTASYLSPEQAKSAIVDERADLYALGCVLYEMCTGRRAFPGEDVTDTIVTVLSKEPDFAALPADVPARIVTGYQGADPQPADGYWVVRQSNAHAWAEYWQDGQGWLRADPTAAVAPDRILRSTALRPAPGLVMGTLDSMSPGLRLQLRRWLETWDNRWNQWVLGYGRQQQFQLLRQAGLDVRYALPREGALAWLDCWAISRHALNPALAHAWINHLLSAPASAALRQRQGLGATTADGDAPADTAPLVWLQPVENDERRNRLWRRIVSGDSAAKVLRS